MWKSYDAFESGHNKLTAKKYLAERSPAYMSARTALREMKQLTDGLEKSIIPPMPKFSDSDRAAVTKWKAYIKWEEGNPLVIDSAELLDHRVNYGLRKCLGQMRHFPDLWCAFRRNQLIPGTTPHHITCRREDWTRLPSISKPASRLVPKGVAHVEQADAVSFLLLRKPIWKRNVNNSTSHRLPTSLCLPMWIQISKNSRKKSRSRSKSSKGLRFRTIMRMDPP
jgi:hypothetical protein